MTCSESSTGCARGALCDKCYLRELRPRRDFAEVIGAQWGERVATATRGREQPEAWPTDERARAIARRKVATLVIDPRMLEPLVDAALAGAAEWWARRPAWYRS